MSTKKTYIILFPIMVLFLLCTFNNQGIVPLELTRIDESGDTVSLWPTLTFASSTPLLDSSVSLYISPNPGAVWQVYVDDVFIAEQNFASITSEIGVVRTVDFRSNEPPPAE